MSRPSKILKKDARKTIRINKSVNEKLTKQTSVQEIIDRWIDENLEIEITNKGGEDVRIGKDTTGVRD